MSCARPRAPTGERAPACQRRAEVEARGELGNLGGIEARHRERVLCRVGDGVVREDCRFGRDLGKRYKVLQRDVGRLGLEHVRPGNPPRLAVVADLEHVGMGRRHDERGQRQGSDGGNGTQNHPTLQWAAHAYPK
jgi:hypothetical protein